MNPDAATYDHVIVGAFTASVCNLNPGSRGFVRPASPRPEDAPRIQARYLSTPEDRRVAAESLRLTRRIVAMPALAKYRPREVKPGVQFQGDEELARLAGDIGTTIFHPVGTCRMGAAGDAGAVVDARPGERGGLARMAGSGQRTTLRPLVASGRCAGLPSGA